MQIHPIDANKARCHALVLELCVLFIMLVRPGCDMGYLCGVFCLGVFVGIGIVGVVLNQRQVFIIVSDWEPDLGSHIL